MCWQKGPEVAGGISVSVLHSAYLAGAGHLPPGEGRGSPGASRSQGWSAMAQWLLGSAVPLGDVDWAGRTPRPEPGSPGEAWPLQV